MKFEKTQPVIKWSGSKRSQAERILSYFGEYNTYYEPFIGGGSILFHAGKDKESIAGDINKPLIELWKLIRDNPQNVYEEYKKNWNQLQEEGYEYYYKLREEFNKEQSPNLLLFLTRTCVNGLIRYNSNGEFNNSFHHSRKGICPERLKKIIFKWSERLKETSFIYGDYRETTKEAKEGDLVYLDPPYFSTKGRYFGTIDYNELIEYLYDLKSRKVKFILSYDGARGENSYLVELPKDLYKEHIFLESGSSTFLKVQDKKVEKVKESLYIG
jgi:DNA adenine methylase